MRRPAAFFRHETNQKETAMKTLSIVAITAFAFLGLANFASAQAPGFQLSSPSFVDCPGIGQRDCPAASTLPSSAIYNRTRDAEDGTPVNECSPTGAPATNRSPALSWTNAPSRATSFAVIVFDSTAQVYHWGIYNIPAFLSRGLRENAVVLVKRGLCDRRVTAVAGGGPRRDVGRSPAAGRARSNTTLRGAMNTRERE